MLEWIGLVGGGATAVYTSLWAFLKWKKGRKIGSIEEVKNEIGPITYKVTVEGDGNSIEISAPVHQLSTSHRVRSAQRGIVAPLGQDGIDSVEVRENGNPLTQLTKEEYEGGAFDVLEGDVVAEEPLEPQEFNCVLVIRAPVFAQRAKWHFYLGEQRITASISDESFVQRVFIGGERFGVGDRLHVRLRLTQILMSTGRYRNDYNILSVEKLEPGPRQLTFLDEPENP